MATTTTRLSIPWPNTPSTDAFVPHTDIGNVALALDNAAMYEQGAIGSIPAGTSKPNGYWYADTATGGRVWVNVGTGGSRAYRSLALGTEVDSVAAATGAPTDGSVRRGKSIIATTESRTNTAYGTMPTPDQVTVALPTDGLIAVAYQATWQESVQSAANAAIFIGANQLRLANNAGGGPAVQQASLGANTGGIDTPLSTTPIGLLGAGLSTSYTGDVTTGQAVGANTNGGLCHVFAAAGTYTVGVRFKASSGSVTAKNRHLWVWVIGF
jgi:hypothetical protein